MNEFTDIDVDNPTQSDVEQLLNYLYEDGVDRREILSMLDIIAEDDKELFETEVIAEHIRRSTQVQVQKRLYSIAGRVVGPQGRPESASALFGVIQDDLTYSDTGDDPTQSDLQKTRSHILYILYSAANNGVEIPSQVLEELYSSILEYPALRNYQFTVNIFGTIIANDSDNANRATEILIELSTLGEETERHLWFKKHATAELAELLDEGEISDSSDVNRIEKIIEQNRELLEAEKPAEVSSDSSDKGLLERLLGIGRNGGDEENKY